MAAEALAAFRESGGFDDLESALHAAVRHHPERTRLLSLGQSRNGRPLYALEIGGGAPRGRTARPAMLVAPDLMGEPRSCARGVVEVAVRLLADLEAEGDLTREVVWLVVPAPVPDRLQGEPAPDSVHPGRNFPVGWDPWCPHPPGPYPLSEPETRALATFLDRVTRVGGALLVGEGEGDSGPVPGGLWAFLEGHLGLSVTTLVAPPPGSGSEVPGDGPNGALDEGLVAALRALPELSLGPPRMECLAPVLWVVEVDVELSLGSRLGEGAPPARPLTLVLEAPAVRGVLAGEPGGTLAVVRTREGGTPLGVLHPGEPRRVQVLVEAEAGERVALWLRAPRAGTTRVEVTLGGQEGSIAAPR